MPKIIIDNVSKSYEPNIHALSRVSLTIKDAETVALMGPSGCGKTTLLRLIAGLELPDEGKITIDGESVDIKTNQTPMASMLFQKSTLYPHLSVYKNIALPLTTIRPKLTKEDIAKRVNAIAKLTDVTHLLKRKPNELSLGERRRSEIATALVQNRPILLIDELSNALDAKARTALRSLIKNIIKKNKITTIIVTHDLVEARALAKRIIKMENGRIKSGNR
ncbi:MAG: ABC transporter ATP-binding protein [Bacilli bacterium]|nr:ABC transporter ATP-binding protein [Bacilli bacterium]